jgi:hypothetical protein
MVVQILLEDGKDAGWRLASLGAGRHRRPQNPSVRVIESDLLGLDRHDCHDRLACMARRRRLRWGRRARLSRFGVGGQRRQRGNGRERYYNRMPPTPDCHGGMRHPKSKCHAIPRLKCQSTLASIRYQITILKSTDPSPTINDARSLLGTKLHVPMAVLHYGTALAAGRRLAAEIGPPSPSEALSLVVRKAIRKRPHPSNKVFDATSLLSASSACSEKNNKVSVLLRQHKVESGNTRSEQM